MTFARIAGFHVKQACDVGGLAYVPPASGLRASHVPAYTAARADRPGSTHSDTTHITRPAGRGSEESPMQPSERIV